MLGATQLLMMSSMDSHQQANLNIITASIDQLREVLSNVLDLAKLKKGAMELEQAPFDLPGILHQVACACVRRRRAHDSQRWLDARVCVCVCVCVLCLVQHRWRRARPRTPTRATTRLSREDCCRSCWTTCRACL